MKMGNLKSKDASEMTKSKGESKNVAWIWLKSGQMGEKVSIW